MNKLLFSPTAWAKFRYIRDCGKTEVSLFGITPPDRLLYVEDVALVRQRNTAMTTAMDDDAVNEYFEAQVAAGRQPAQFARIWLHTHPGMGVTPSGTDEETFRQAFGTASWAIMVILNTDDQTYARLQFNVGPGGSCPLTVAVDYDHPFPAADFAAWRAEYKALVEVAPLHAGVRSLADWFRQDSGVALPARVTAHEEKRRPAAFQAREEEQIPEVQLWDPAWLDDVPGWQEADWHEADWHEDASFEFNPYEKYEK